MRGYPEEGKGKSKSQDDEMRRRQLLSGAAAGLAGMTMEGWGVFPPPVRPVTGDRPIPIGSLTEPWLGSLEKATETMLRELRWYGSRRNLEGIAFHAQGLGRVYRGMSSLDPLRKRVAGATATACHVAAHHYLDQLQPRKAAAWFRQTAEYATVSGHDRLALLARCGMAGMKGFQGIDEPLQVLEPLSEGTRPSLQNFYVSVEQALSLVSFYNPDRPADKDRRYEAAAKLDRLDVIAERLPDEAPVDMFSSPPSYTVVHWRGMVAARLGSAAEARPALEASLRLKQPGNRMERGKILATLGLVEARAGEVERSAERLNRAWDLLYQADSRRAQQTIRLALKQLPAGARVTRGLREHLREV